MMRAQMASLTFLSWTLLYIVSVIPLTITAKSNYCCNPCQKPQEYSSKTFFSGVKIFEVGKPVKEMFFLNDRMDQKEDSCWGGALQIVGYGSQSTNSAGLAQYFMPYAKCSLYVTEYKPASGQGPYYNDDYNRDLEARNFNIATIGNGSTADLSYSGTISLAPKQTVAGIGFTWKQTLWRDSDENPSLWLEVSFPVEYRKNDLGLCETVITTGNGAQTTSGLSSSTHVGTMTAALQQAGMLFGKIQNCHCDSSRWGVADVETRVGFNSIKGECCDVNGYFGFVAPTGTKVDAQAAQWLFPTIIGNNHHWGLMFGSHVGFLLLERGKHRVRYDLDMCSKWLFPNHQIRTFDLVQQGEWSRYLELYESLDQAEEAAAATAPASYNLGTFGTNILTQCVKVEPRFNTNVNTAIQYLYTDNFEFDAGYNLYVRQAERIELNKLSSASAVKDIQGGGAINLARTIKNNFPNAAEDIDTYALHEIDLCNINLNSAAAPAVLSSTVYGGMCYNFECCSVPGFVGFGGLYEFSLANASADRWIVMGKVGFSY